MTEARPLTTEQTRELRKQFVSRPRSICTCGHTGDGPGGDHAWIDTRTGLPTKDGHGSCIAEGCSCNQFKWAAWTTEFQTALDKVRGL